MGESGAGGAAPEREFARCVKPGGPRIGVAFPGDPSSPTAWSGIPAGIMNGLREMGADPVGLSVVPRSARSRMMLSRAIEIAALRRAPGRKDALRQAKIATMCSPLMADVQSFLGSRALRAAGSLDAIVQIGSDFELDTDVPVSTLEDMTVLQARDSDYPGWQTVPAAAYEKRVARQQRIYAQATACCAATPWAANSIVEQYGVTADKVHVVGFGRNIEIPNAEHRDWTKPRFLFVGMDWRRKNGEAVLRQFARLRQTCPVATLDLVGDTPTVFQDGVINHGVLRRGVPEQQARHIALFAAATCLVVPSRTEAAGIVYLEAGAAGLPSIGTTVGGAGFFIGGGGATVDPDDDEALLAAFQYFADPHRARAAGAVARKHSAQFTWAKVAERLLGALQVLPSGPTSTC